MKKLLILLLILSLIFLSGCAIIPSDKDAMALAGITHEPGTNHSKFILNGFEGKYSVKLDREGLGDGTIYYYADLTLGDITVSYDLGTLFDAEPLFTASAESSVSSVGGYVYSDTVYLIIESSSSASGTVIIDFKEPITP